MESADKRPSRQRPDERESEVSIVVPIVAKVAAEVPAVPLLGPLVGALADLVKKHISRTKEAARLGNEQRLADFYSEMFDADARMDEQVAAAMVDNKDFHALLRACIADIEAEKVRAYANLARGIASGTVAKQWRRHFILSLRDLSSDGLERLRGAWVAAKHPLIPAQGPSMGQEHFLDPGLPGSLQAITVSNLASRGLIHDDKLSPAGQAFAEACFRPADLTPASIGFREWSADNVAIISYEIGDDLAMRLGIALQEGLRSAGTKSSIIALQGSNVQQARMVFTMGVLLVQGHSEHLTGNLEHLESFVNKVPTVLVEVSDHPAEVAQMPFFERVRGSGKDQAALVTEVCQSIAVKSRELAARRRP